MGVRQTLGVVAVFASTIAVAGTLLGSTLTYLFQRFSAGRSERLARDERLRQERLASYSAFAGAMTELRRGVITLWFRRQSESDAAELIPVLTEADRLGASADHARFRVQLVAEDDNLVALADAAFEPISSLRHASSRMELIEHEKRSQEILKAFITAAGDQVR